MTTRIINGRCVDARHLDIERERNLSGEIAWVDRFGPDALISLGTKADRFDFDLIFSLLGHSISIETERFPKWIELRKADMTRLTRGLVFASKSRDGNRR